MQIEWSEFKNIVNIKQMSIQFIQHSGNYHLRAIDGVFILECAITLDSSNPDTIDFETNYKAKGNKRLPINYPFADKVLYNGSKIFTRIHGVSASVHNEVDNIDFTVPYPACKITGIDIIGGKLGDKVNFKILDTVTGTLTGIPNYQLNQFGFSMNVAQDLHSYKSDYDADLFQNLVIRVEYDAIDEASERPIYINFILHEVKS